MKTCKLSLAIVALGSIAACSGTGLRPYGGSNDFIAIATDGGIDSGSNASNNAAIAVTPDGCQAWLIDDGVEGRASNRLDPVSGLPVCSGEPGIVYGQYQSGNRSIPDFVPRNPAPVTVQNTPIRSVQGHFH